MRNAGKYLILLIIFYACTNSESPVDTKLVNSAHLDDLYQEIEVNGEMVGIIHIYSEYPDYKWVGDSDEGSACIDDAARAEIFYIREFNRSGNEEYLRKSEMLLKFILNLHADNGYFYNFVWADGKINTDFKTSVAEAGWWSWRALWALSESYETILIHNTDLAQKIKTSMDGLVTNIERDFITSNEYQEIDGFRRPTWLPHGTASDQAALMVIALTNYLKINDSEKLQNLVLNMCDGIIAMQEGDEKTFPHGAFLSWENNWHGWGNSQAFALLTAGEFFNKNEFIESALEEVKYYYPFLIKSGFYNEFKLVKNADPEFKKYSQIAYELRPMIFATLKAFELTDDNYYSKLAGELGLWFFGNNVSNEQLYFPSTGICYDGINSQNDLNKNSGAESTIEALLALQMLETNITALQVITNYQESE